MGILRLNKDLGKLSWAKFRKYMKAHHSDANAQEWYVKLGGKLPKSLTEKKDEGGE
jgi:hypothetical protein